MAKSQKANSWKRFELGNDKVLRTNEPGVGASIEPALDIAGLPTDVSDGLILVHPR